MWETVKYKEAYPLIRSHFSLMYIITQKNGIETPFFYEIVIKKANYILTRYNRLSVFYFNTTKSR